MAYTNPWTDNTPVGGDPAANLSADLRRLKLDISERMISIIPGFTTDDPVSLVPSASSIESSKSYDYNANLADPAVSATIVRSCLVLDVEGRTNIIGRLIIDFQPGEFDEDWDLSPPSLVGIVPLAWWNDTVNDFCFPVLLSVVGNVITFLLEDQDGSGLANTDIRGRLLLFFGTISLPNILSIVPNTGAQGANVNVTITGTNFIGTEAQINISGTLITVVNIVVVSPTQITAQFQINIAAALGARNVSVTTVGGTSNNVVFTVI